MPCTKTILMAKIYITIIIIFYINSFFVSQTVTHSLIKPTKTIQATSQVYYKNIFYLLKNLFQVSQTIKLTNR